MSATRLRLLAVTAWLAGCAFPGVAPPVASVPMPALKGGERWVYEQINPYNGTRVRTIQTTLEKRPGGFEVTGRSDRAEDPVETETVSEPWLVSAESTGTTRRTFDAPLAVIRFPIEPGAHGKQKLHATDERGVTRQRSVTTRAVRWERVKTPAGEFAALRVERQMNLGDGGGQWNDTMVYDVFWYVPEVRRWVRLEHRYEQTERIVRSPRVNKDWIVWQLASYALAD